MIYNPIFEEEKERKTEMLQLKKQIKKRARQEGIKQTIDRLYILLKKKPILSIVTVFSPIANLFKVSKSEEKVASKT